MRTASAVPIEADDGLDGCPADGAVEGLRESLQRFPSREEVDRRLFADGRQPGDRRASIADENRSVLPGCSHPRAGTPVQLPDRDLLHVSHCHTSLVRSASHGPPFEKRPVAAPRSFRGRGHRSPGRCCDGHRVTKSPIGSIEVKIPAAAGGVPHSNFSDIERQPTILAGPRRELHGAQKRQFRSGNRGTLSCTPRTR